MRHRDRLPYACELGMLTTRYGSASTVSKSLQHCIGFKREEYIIPDAQALPRWRRPAEAAIATWAGFPRKTWGKSQLIRRRRTLKVTHAAAADSRETRAYSQRAQKHLQLYILYYTLLVLQHHFSCIIISLCAPSFAWAQIVYSLSIRGCLSPCNYPLSSDSACLVYLLAIWVAVPESPPPSSP